MIGRARTRCLTRCPRSQPSTSGSDRDRRRAGGRRHRRRARRCGWPPSGATTTPSRTWRPAPVGCDTTLEFDDDGTYYVFAETKGEVGDVDGDCENDEQRYDGEDTDLDVVMFDDDDEDLDLDREDDVSYDNGESVGTSLYTVDIPARR